MTDRRFRRAKVIAAISLLAAVTALLIYLGSRYSPPPRPALLVLGDPIYDDLSLPLNAGTRKAENGGEGHADLIALTSGARHLFAEAGGEQDRNWGRLTADQVLKESPNLLARVCYSLPRTRQGRVALVYCGLLGLPGPNGAKLLVSGRASGGEDTDQAFAAADWLRSLDASAQREEARVLVLLDPGPAVASWRRGVLAPEFAAQLRDELERENLTHVTVLMAAGPGESSWRITDVLKSPAGVDEEADADTGETTADAESPPGPEEVGRSVFSYYVLQGLCGDGTGRGTADTSGDARITGDELFSFVADRVNDWARTRRGIPQTVTKLGAPGDFVIATVEKRVLPPTLRAAVGEGQPEKSSGRAKPGKKPAASEPAEDPSLALNGRLDVLWSRLAGARSSSGGASAAVDASSGADATNSAVSELTAGEWRRMRELLVAAESSVRFGILETADRHLSDAETLLKNSSAESPAAGQPDGSWLRPFLASLPDAKPPAEGEKDPAKAPDTADAKTVLEQLAIAPDKAPELKFTLRTRESVQEVLVWFIEKASQADSADRLQKLAAALATVERAGLSPLSDGSPELRLLSRLGAAAASPDWKGVDEKPLVASSARLMTNLSRAGGIGVDDPPSLVAARGPLVEGLRHLATAERWITAAADFEMANEHLGKAEQAFASAKSQAKLAGETRRLRARFAIELPSFAEWLSAERERERTSVRDGGEERASRHNALGVLGDTLDQIASQAAPGNRVEWHRIAEKAEDAWSDAGVPNSEAESALSVLLMAWQALREDAAAVPLDESDLETLRESRKTLIQSAKSEIDIARGDSDWIALERALLLADSPELIEDRREVRDALSAAALLPRDYVATNGTAAWAPGVWRGFWGRQLVRAAGGEAIDTAKAEWNAYLASAGEADEAEARAARLSFGAALAERFRTLDFTDSELAPRQPVGGARTLVLSLFADADALVSGTAEVRQAWNDLGVAVLNAAPDPELAPASSRSESVAYSAVVASSAREAVLPLRSAEGRQLFVKIRRPAKGEVLLNGERVEGPLLPVAADARQANIVFDSELIGAAFVTVARLDSRGFPVEIERVTVSQKERWDRWAVRFAIGPERTLLNDAPDTLRLPPAAQAPIELVPLLEFPSSTAESSVRVAVERPNGRGGWETVLGPKAFELLDEGPTATSEAMRTLPLDFSIVPPAGAASAATPAVATAAATFRLDEGFRFLIRAGDEELPPREIWPETFGVGQYVVDSTSAPRVELISDPAMPRIEIVVTPARRDDPRLPEAVKVGMYVDPRLATLITARQEPALLPLGGDALQTIKLTAAIDPAKLDEFRALEGGDGFVVGLDVEPLRRALRWRLQRGRIDRIRPDESPIELELVGPPAPGAQAPPPAAATAALEPVSFDAVLGAFVVPREQVPGVRLRYHLFKSRDAGTGTAAERAWNASLLSRAPGQAPVELPAISFPRLQNTRMEVSVEGGIWKTSVRSLPHETGLPHTAVGRVELSAELRRPGAEGDDGTSSVLRLAVDNGPPPKPEVRTLRQAGPQRVAVNGMDVQADREFSLTTRCDEDDSAIRTIELQLDSDNNGAFAGPGDVTLRQSLSPGSDPWARSFVTNPWTIKPSMLPATGDLSLRVVAIDGLGKQTESDRLRLELIRPRPKPVPKPKTTGTLIVNVKSPQRVTGPITLTVTGSDGTKLEKSQNTDQFVFEDLKPGDYSVVATRGLTRKRTGTGSAKIEATDEPKTLAVEIK